METGQVMESTMNNAHPKKMTAFVFTNCEYYLWTIQSAHIWMVYDRGKHYSNYMVARTNYMAEKLPLNLN